MNKILTVTCLMAACASVRAGDTNAAAPTVDTKATVPAAYVPKTKSVFNPVTNAHNPFWPIGWVKTETDQTSDTAAPYVPRVEDFMVSTIMLNEPPMAVINGKDMAEGEIAALPVNGVNVVVQLMAVQDGRVILRWQGQNIVVPIHRDEMLSEPTISQR
jgi:hypothetical protein